MVAVVLLYVVLQQDQVQPAKVLPFPRLERKRSNEVKVEGGSTRVQHNMGLWHALKIWAYAVDSLQSQNGSGRILEMPAG